MYAVWWTLNMPCKTSEERVCVYEFWWDAVSTLQGKSGLLGQLSTTTKSHQRSGWKPCHKIFYFSQSTPQWVFAHGLIDWLKLRIKHMGFWPQQNHKSSRYLKTFLQSYLIYHNTGSEYRISMCYRYYLSKDCFLFFILALNSCKLSQNGECHFLLFLISNKKKYLNYC